MRITIASSATSRAASISVAREGLLQHRAPDRAGVEWLTATALAALDQAALPEEADLARGEHPGVEPRMVFTSVVPLRPKPVTSSTRGR